MSLHVKEYQASKCKNQNEILKGGTVNVNSVCFSFIAGANPQ